jgi:hypothetical protein
MSKLLAKLEKMEGLTLRRWSVWSIFLNISSNLPGIAEVIEKTCRFKLCFLLYI